MFLRIKLLRTYKEKKTYKCGVICYNWYRVVRNKIECPLLIEGKMIHDVIRYMTVFEQTHIYYTGRLLKMVINHDGKSRNLINKH